MIYLALQVRHSSAQLRQTTKTISTSAFHGITSLVIPMRSALIAERGICELMVQARKGLASVDDADRYRFGLCAGMVFQLLADIYEYHRSGLRDQSQWDNWVYIVDQNLENRWLREYWVHNAGSYTVNFQRVVGSALAKRWDA